MLYTLGKNGLVFDVRPRNYGMQDRGISPQGASDMRSYRTAQILLDTPDIACTEMIYVPTVSFEKDVLFVLVGAHYESMQLQRGHTLLSINLAQVYSAQKGDVLRIQNRTKGYRLYLAAVAHTPQNSHLIGRKRPPFDMLFDTLQSIRFFWGIHSDVLKNKAHFAKEKWQLDEASSLMGIRLKGAMLEATTHDIPSSSVSDGTIQLTKNGPIILMRHRQTTGGYAQIAHIYEVDINTLAQIALGQSIYLKEGTLSDAKRALKAEEKALKAWQNRLTP